MRQVTTASVTAGQLGIFRQDKVRFTVDWLYQVVILLLCVIFILFSYFINSIQTVTIKNSVAFEPSDGQNSFGTSCKRPVIVPLSSVTFQNFPA